VHYLSQPAAGKRHDKKMADEENPPYPQAIGVYQDPGFQGYAPDGVQTFQPQKTPKGTERTPEQKEHNRLSSSLRIVMEHIIAGIKRCRIVKDIVRTTKDQYDDLVMEIACGLPNFRVHCRGS
jgi:DDE superfamily endonuclease